MTKGLIRLAIAVLLTLSACSGQEVPPPSNPDAATEIPDASDPGGPDASAGPDAQVCDPALQCGTTCCKEGEVCDNGACKACVAETDAELCTRLDRLCGELTAVDNCGKQRTVASCGGCETGFICDLSKGECVDNCQRETDAQFCARNLRECGALTANDNCGQQRTVADCGTCASGEICNAQDGQCVVDCKPETNPEFCSRLGKACGAVTGKDNCNKDRVVAECGPCASDKRCDANQCVPICTPETDAAFCTRLKKACGSFAGTDNCGQARTADCGSCGLDKDCNPANNTCYDVCWTDQRFCQNFGAQCGSLSQVDNCGTLKTVDCGACPTGQSCSAAINTCVACQPETDAAFCTRLGKNCGAVTGTDSCGATRTVASCGTCTSPQTCNNQNVCATPGVPANDTCTSPEVIVLDATGKATIAGDTTGATANVDGGSCNSASGKDVVYSLTLASTKHVEIVVTPDAGSLLKPNVFVLTTCTDEATQLTGACKSQSSVLPASLAVRSLAAGTYFIWVDGWSSSSNGAFTMSVTATDPSPAPINDVCTGAMALALDPVTNRVTIGGNTIDAVNDYTGSCATTTYLLDAPDVVYSFTLTSPMSVAAQLASSGNPAVYIRGDCSDTASEKVCNKNTSGGITTAVAQNLPIGTYYVIVDGTTSAMYGSYTLDLIGHGPVSNNTCATPEALSFDATGVATAVGDTLFSTASITSSCNSSSTGNDLLYSFVVPAGVTKNVEIEVTPAAGSNLKPNVSVRGTCDQQSTEVGCAANAAVSATKLTVLNPVPNQTYYVWVDGKTGYDGAFTLTATLKDPPPPPANDLCAGAELLTFTNGKAQVTAQSTLGAADNYAGACATASLPHNGPDRVYAFTLTAAQKVVAKVTGSGTLKPAVYLRKVCDSAAMPDQAGCGNNSSGVATATALNLQPGTYYAVVDGISNSFGDYSLEVTLDAPLAIPDDCYNAQELTLAPGVTTTLTGDTTQAMNNTKSLISGLGGGNDVVYSFTLQRPMNIAAVLSFTDTANWPVLYVRRVCDTTTTADEIVTDDDSSGTASITAKALPAGTYYLWVDAFTGDAGTYTLDVTSTVPPPPPANDNCTSPQVLTLTNGAVTVTGNTTDAANDSAGTCNAMPGGDVVYQLTIPGPDHVSLNAKVTRDPASTSFQPAVYIRSNCTGTATTDQVACAKYTSSLPAPIATVLDLAPGTYSIIVDGLTADGGYFTLEVTTGAPRVYPDTCALAVPITLSRAGSAMVGTVADDTTNAANDATGSCGTMAGPDLVYTFDTTGMGTKNLAVTLSYVPAGSIYPGIYLRTTCGDTATEKGCRFKSATGGSGPAYLTVPSLAEGVYYLFVDSDGMSYKGPFTLTVSLADPPAGDQCATAQPLTFVGDTATVTGASTAYAVNDSTGSCATMDGTDVVYSFTVPGTVPMSATATVTSLGTSLKPGVYIRSVCDSADASNQKACNSNSTGTVTSAKALSLDPGTYYVVVDGLSSSKGDYDLTVQLGAAQVFPDNCSTAWPVQLDRNGYALLTADTTGGVDDGTGTCRSTGMLGNDVVYTIDTTGQGVKDLVARVKFSSTSNYAGLYLRSVCTSAAAADEVACSTGSSATSTLTKTGLAEGVYYLFVDTNTATLKGPFNLEILLSTPPTSAPANDSCSAAIPVDLTSGAASVTGDTRLSTNDSTGTCSTMAGGDVVYSFTVAQEAMVSAKVTAGLATPSYTPAVYIRSDCASGALADQRACATPSSGVATAAIARAMPGTTYYVIVDGTGGTSGAFTLDFTTGPALRGDICADAVAMPAFDPTTGISEVTSDNTNANNDTSGTCSYGRDLVYTFTLAATKKVDITVTPGAGSLLQPAVFLRTDCNQTATELGCAYKSTPVAATLAYPTLPAGTYYVWVDTYTSSANGTFTLKVTAVDPTTAAPANDVCTGAEALTFTGSPAKATVGTTAAPVDITGAVHHTTGTCGFGRGADVVYSFQTSADQKVTAKVVRSSTTSSFEPLVYIRSACDREDVASELTCAKHSSGTATATVNNLPAGTYFVIVDGLKGSTGKFTLEVTLDAPVTTGPTNENCASVSPITLTGTTATIQGSTASGVSEAAGSCSTNTASAPDVVYSVEVTQAGQRIKATLDPASTYAPAIYIRNSCASYLTTDELVCQYNSTADTTLTALAKNLQPGTYYVWVDGGSTGTTSNNGQFTLDVNVDFPQPPVNDTCRAPEALTQGVTVTGDTLEANLDYGPSLPSGTCSTTSVKGPEVVYSYTPTADGDFTVTMQPTGFDAVLWYSVGTCDIAACAGRKDDGYNGGAETLTITGVAGTTYYLFADGYFDYGYGRFTIKVQ